MNRTFLIATIFAAMTPMMTQASELIAIDDISGGKTLFKVLAGAPSHSISVNADDFVGIGTESPGQQVHIVSGNLPSIRLEQDGMVKLSAPIGTPSSQWRGTVSRFLVDSSRVFRKFQAALRFFCRCSFRMGLV